MAISADSQFVHKAWCDQELSNMVDGHIPFPMATDIGGETGKLYGVYDEASGMDIRGAFVINPDGIVEGYEILQPAVGRNIDETLRQLQAFKHVREAKGAEAMPMGWKPGKKVLKPSAEAVGKIWKEWTVEEA